MKEGIVNRILSETPRQYDRIAADFSDTRGGWWQGFGDFAKYAKAGDSVLDLGCGNGRMAQLFTESGVNYLGLDNSQELIKIARSRFNQQSNFRFEIADATDLRLDSDSFDLVLVIAVLHHIPTRRLRLKILRDLYLAMKPGGKLIVSNWNLWKLTGRKPFRYYGYLLDYLKKFGCGVWSPTDAIIPWKANLQRHEWQDRYVHSYRKGEMKRLLAAAGFTVESVGYASKTQSRATIISGDNLLAVATKKC